ncbi:MAG: hypothetical protein IGS03_12155 [Candidatus Sericytochromatia bacterium]|nr:hypothetical protein [Candidatus Sericytochromatia bacterium]
MKQSAKKWTLALLSPFLLMGPVGAQDYPPAMVYDQMPDFINLGNDGTLYFGRKLQSMQVYVPQRDVETRIDIVDAEGKILSTKERVYKYKNGPAEGEMDTWVTACASGQCANGPSTFPLKPGVHWIVFSEKGKVFAAEWFEIRAAAQGEGRFAKGSKHYAVLPQDNMARLYFTDNGKGKLIIEFGMHAGAEVGDSSAVTKKMRVSLKHNGKEVGKSAGNQPQPTNIYPSTTMINATIVKSKDNSGIQKADLKDGQYEIDVNMDGKSVRRFKFEVKGGKIVYQGRQQESTQPMERMIVSESAYWLWNIYAKAPDL